MSLWAEVVQAREPVSGQHVYTVAAQTDVAGLLYLTVSVSRLAIRLSRPVRLSGLRRGAGFGRCTRRLSKAVTVEDPQLEVVVRRALANYLSATGSELAADLAPGAHVSLPPNALTLESIQRPTWATGGAVQVVSQAHDARGVRYTLAYELDVARDARALGDIRHTNGPPQLGAGRTEHSDEPDSMTGAVAATLIALATLGALLDACAEPRWRARTA